MSAAENTEQPALARVVELFQRYGVEFIVIGGQAAVLLGSPLPTYDVDLCYRRTADNLERLAIALREIHPTLRGAPPDLPFRLDKESLALGSNYTFRTDYGSLDLLGWVEPLGTYEDLAAHAEPIQLGPYRIEVIGLEDLIKVKRHIRRSKDEAVLIQLEAIKQIRAEQQRSG